MTIHKMVKDLVEASQMAKVEEKTMTRFSVYIKWEDNRRLEYVAKKLGMSKSSIVSNLIEAGLAEFEAELAITDTQEKLVEYWSWVNSNDPVPDFKDDIGDVTVTYTDHKGTREIDMKGEESK